MTYGMLTGATLTLALVVALLFFRAYRRTEDRLFLLFGFAFGVLAAERLLIALTGRTETNEPFAFVPRIVAFAIMLVAIIDRNRR